MNGAEQARLREQQARRLAEQDHAEARGAELTLLLDEKALLREPLVKRSDALRAEYLAVLLERLRIEVLEPSAPLCAFELRQRSPLW